MVGFRRWWNFKFCAGAGTVWRVDFFVKIEKLRRIQVWISKVKFNWEMGRRGGFERCLKRSIESGGFFVEIEDQSSGKVWLERELVQGKVQREI